MNAVFIASDEADARAGAAVVEHHAQMEGAMAIKVEAVANAVDRRDQSAVDEARSDLVDWCRAELVPHALAEEGTIYAAAAGEPSARLLVEAMLAEHQYIIGIVEDLAASTDGVRSVALAGALRAIFETHVAKENDQIIPLLVAAPSVSVAELLGGMHELLGGAEQEHGHGAAPDEDHACTCGDSDSLNLPELDARDIPHAIRHATIFGALDGLGSGAGLVLVAPHEPLPLLQQLEQRSPGAFTVEYLERGPDAWRLSLTRAGRGSATA